MLTWPAWHYGGTARPVRRHFLRPYTCPCLLHPSSGPTWLSGSDMILAIILLARSGVSGLNGRRRTRDWSGRRIVPVRWTFVEAVIMNWRFLRIVTESCDY